MNIIDPKSLYIIRGLPPVASKTDKVAIDLEIFGMDKKKLHRPTNGTFASMQITLDGKTVYIVEDEQEVQEALSIVQDGVWIFHNAKFDLTHLRRWATIPQRKRLWDSMLIEQIMFSGYYTDFSLRDLARRYLGVYMEKETRSDFSDAIEMTPEMLNYSAVDVVATWRVYQEQRKSIDENDLNIWKDIELPFLWVLLGMGGIKLDSEKWINLARKNEQIAKDIQAKYGEWQIKATSVKETSVFVGINLNSPAQVKAHLKTLGYKLESTDVDALEGISDECEFAKNMLVYRTYAKRSSTYGEKFVSDYMESDGKIYGDIFQIGAQTGRVSSRSPNLQNIPKEFEYRDCFIAEENRCIVVADWGSQEPRIAAYLSQDERLIDALNSDEKLYVRIARDALGITITKQSPEYSHMKSTILGIFYGMSAKGLAARIDVSEEEAQEMIDTILRTYPGVAEYIERQKKSGEYMQSIYGRKIWLNKYSNGWLRDALNYPIQSSAADAMKIAAYEFCTKWEGDWDQGTLDLRLLVHDEICLSVDNEDCNNAKDTLSNVMVQVAEHMHEGIKGVAEVYSGSSWGAKH